jgi:tetratricopeptide (TPR) repeat protein
MSRYFFRFAILAAWFFPASAVAQIFVPGVTVKLYGTFTVTARDEAKLPGPFTIILYGVDRSIFGRIQVANHGNYQFDRVPNGDWEIAIEAAGQELLRIPYSQNFAKSSEYRKDIELEWREKSFPAAAKPGTISAKDIYPRSPAHAPLMKQALAASGKKNYSEAAVLLKKIVEADAKDFEAWTELGNVLFSQGENGEADKAFKRALEERQTYPVALLNLGKMQYSQKEYDASIQTLSKLVSEHPESAEAHRFLGEAYLSIKKGSKAVPELEEASRLDPAGQAEAHLRLAALYDGAGVKDRAAAEYEKFLAKKPDYPDKKKLEQYIRDNKKR